MALLMSAWQLDGILPGLGLSSELAWVKRLVEEFALCGINNPSHLAPKGLGLSAMSSNVRLGRT